MKWGILLGLVVVVAGCADLLEEDKKNKAGGPGPVSIKFSCTQAANVGRHTSLIGGVDFLVNGIATPDNCCYCHNSFGTTEGMATVQWFYLFLSAPQTIRGGSGGFEIVASSSGRARTYNVNIEYGGTLTYTVN